MYSALVFLRSYDSLKFKLTVILSVMDFTRSGMFYDSYSSVHCVRCFPNNYVGMSFLHMEHSIELQCLMTFFTSLRVVYLSSRTRYFSSIFWMVSAMFLLACISYSLDSSSLQVTDFWNAMRRASCSFLFSFIVFLRKATWFSR